MIYYSAEDVKYHLFYYWNFHNFTMGGEADPIPRVDKKTRRSTDAYFVPLALENAFVDEAFGTLTPQEQKILVELYMDDGRDESYTDKYKEWQVNIRYTDEAIDELSRRLDKSTKEIHGIQYDAIGKLIKYMNGGETKEGFEQEYIRKSKITPEFYHEYFVTLPCHCGEVLCKGWACVSNNPESIKTHKRLYGKG